MESQKNFSTGDIVAYIGNELKVKGKHGSFYKIKKLDIGTITNIDRQRAQAIVEFKSYAEKHYITIRLENLVKIRHANKMLVKRPLIINLFGVPGAGKSTGAAYIFSQIKMAGINAELITEYAKEKIWEQNDEALQNQAYIFGEQYYRISRCGDKVDVIITDSPLPLNIIYNTDKRLSENFNNTVMDVFNTYFNLNYLLFRDKPYNMAGRKQTEEESDALMKSVISLLKNRHIPYRSITGDINGYNEIIREVFSTINGAST